MELSAAQIAEQLDIAPAKVPDAFTRLQRVSPQIFREAME
jgi:hypothetical protein